MINDGCAIKPTGKGLILSNKRYMILTFVFPSWLLYIGVSFVTDDGVNLTRLLHCTYLGLSIITAVTATLYVAMCNTSWLISVDRRVPRRAGRVTLALLAGLWRLSSLILSPSAPLLLLLRVQLLIADSCLRDLKRASSAEWSGCWVTGTSIMTWGRCRPRISSRSDGLACNTKARADNGRRLIEKYSSKSWHLPWGEWALTGTTNLEASILTHRAIFLLLSAALWFTEVSVLDPELLRY